MALDLILPDRLAPSNLHLPESVRATYVDGDVYNICEQMRALDPSLYAVLLEGDDRHAYAIMERCDDGIERLIFKVAELDGRVLDRLRELMAVPLQERLRRLEVEEDRAEASRKDNELEKLYETLGRPMLTQLDHDGFVPGGRGVSYPKSGVTGGRGSKAKS